MLQTFSQKYASSFKKIAHVLTNTVLIITLSVGMLVPALTNAATLTSAADTMSNEKVSANSDHTFTWTSVAAYAANDTITITSSTANNYTSAGSWVVGDFQLTMTGGTNGTSATNPVAVASSGPSCSAGAGNYTVTYTNSTSPSFVITLCSSFGTTSTTSAVTFKIKGATGTGTLTNKSSAVASTLWTITNGVGNTDSTTVAGVIITDNVVVVSATVNPTLTFSLGATTVSLGTLTTGTTGTGQHTLLAATNGSGGLAITYSGTTLTATGGTIAAYGASAVVPAAGTAGYGINLKANTSPSVASSDNPITNAGATCTAATPYNSVNEFAFVGGSTITSLASAGGAADCTFRVSYIANISSVTPSGSYSSSISYIATGTF